MNNSISMNFMILLLITLLSLPSAYAYDNEIVRGVLSGVFGELPLPCTDLENPECWECMIVGKILPLGIFSFVGFLLMCFFLSQVMFRQGTNIVQVMNKYASYIGPVVVITGVIIMHILPAVEFYRKFGNVTSFWFWLKIILLLSTFYFLIVIRDRSVISRLTFLIIIIIFMVGIFIIFRLPQFQPYIASLQNLTYRCFE